MATTFQLTAARRRLRMLNALHLDPIAVSTHSRPKAAADADYKIQIRITVSTHSRPKAAAAGHGEDAAEIQSFNSQPPEGGCICALTPTATPATFQLTAARRRLLSTSKSAKNQLITNSLSLTHSDVREFGKYSVRFCAIQPYK